MVAVAYQRSRFYHDLCTGAGIDAATAVLEDLPPVTKEMLRADFDRVVTIHPSAVLEIPERDRDVDTVQMLQDREIIFN